MATKDRITGREESSTAILAAMSEKRIQTALLTRTTLDGRLDSAFSALYPDVYGTLRRDYRRRAPLEWDLPAYYEVFRRECGDSGED